MATAQYTGTIIEESLTDSRALDGIDMLGFKVTNDPNPADRWHMYKVSVSKEQIDTLAKYIKSGTWYMHFWDRNKNIIAVFKDKVFTFVYDKKETWKDAVEYGLSVGIPQDQLTFVIE